MLTFKLSTACNTLNSCNTLQYSGCNSIIKLQNQTKSQSRNEINIHTEHLVQKHNGALALIEKKRDFVLNEEEREQGNKK